MVKEMLLKAEKIPTEKHECPHIKKARRYLAFEAIQSAIARRLQAANQNREKNGHKPREYEPEGCAL